MNTLALFLGGCTAFAALVLQTPSYAQSQAYRWKDEQGRTHISDFPPPASCSSQDCREIDSRLRKKTEDAKRAMEESAASNAQHRASMRRIIDAAKAELRHCRTSPCSLESLMMSFKTVAYNEGQWGVTEALGRPQKVQQMSGHMSERQYWYYRLHGTSVQLVWEARTGNQASLESVNLY